MPFPFWFLAMFKTMRRAALWALVVCQPMAAFSVAALAQKAPSGEELLRAMAQAERGIAYEGVEIVTQKGSPALTMQVWRSGPRRRLEFLGPPIMQGDLLVDDGNTVWSYHRADNAATQTRTAPRGAYSVDVAQISSGLEARVSGTGTVAGRTAWIVAAYARGQQQPVRKFWIDQATRARLRVEGYTANGQLVERDTLQRVAFGPVAASRFHWTPPSGTDVKRTSGTLFTDLEQAQRVGWLRFPGRLPVTYVFESAIVDPRGSGGQGEAWLRFTNGMSRFSVFQQRTSDNQTKEPQQVQEVKNAWYWQKNGSRFLLVGLKSSEAAKVMDGMQ